MKAQSGQHCGGWDILENKSGQFGQVVAIDCTSCDILQITRLAIERNETLRDQYLLEIGVYDPQQLVFIDESAIDRRTPHRKFGWALSGERVQMKGHFVRGGRYVFDYQVFYPSHDLFALGIQFFQRCLLMELSSLPSSPVPLTVLLSLHLSRNY